MKLGLVLEGGASRTYFSCGVLDALLEEKIYADYVIGVSAGISFGVSYVSRQKGRNLEILRRYESDKRYMGIRHMFNSKNRSFYNLDFVFDTVPNRLVQFDYKTFTGRQGNCIAVVTDINTGEPAYIEMDGDKRFMALRASCALPILFQPVGINGRLYMDGGISNSIPFKKAFDDGCDKVLVLLTRPRDYVKSGEGAEKLVKLMYGKKYPKLVQKISSRPERYNAQLEELRGLEKDKRVMVIAPSDTHGIGRTEKDLKILEPFYWEGYNCAMENMEKIRNYCSAN